MEPEARQLSPSPSHTPIEDLERGGDPHDMHAAPYRWPRWAVILALMLLQTCGLLVLTMAEGAPHNWMTNLGIDQQEFSTQFIVSTYWASQTLTTVGYGDVPMITNSERVYAIVCHIVGHGLLSCVTAGLTASNTSDESEQGVDAVNYPSHNPTDNRSHEDNLFYRCNFAGAVRVWNSFGCKCSCELLRRILRILVAIIVMAAVLLVISHSEAAEHNWMSNLGIADSGWQRQAIVAVYWASQTFTTVGYGDAPMITNFERLYAIGCHIIGHLLLDKPSNSHWVQRGMFQVFLLIAMALGLIVISLWEDADHNCMTNNGIEQNDMVTFVMGALYWASQTLYTIGYGDIPMITNLERVYATVWHIFAHFLLSYLETPTTSTNAPDEPQQLENVATNNVTSTSARTQSQRVNQLDRVNIPGAVRVCGFSFAFLTLPCVRILFLIVMVRTTYLLVAMINSSRYEHLIQTAFLRFVVPAFEGADNWMSNNRISDESTLMIAAGYWATQTLYTIGYGDVSMSTDAGRVFAVAFHIVGHLLL